MNALSIVLLSIVAALLYGIIHDELTARVCVEYFTSRETCPVPR